jgi:hypothetical protein
MKIENELLQSLAITKKKFLNPTSSDKLNKLMLEYRKNAILNSQYKHNWLNKNHLKHI